MTSARDWINQATIGRTIWDRWPHYRVWLVAADDFDASRLAATADDLFQQAVDSAKSDDVDDHVMRWQHAYRDFGVKPRAARSSVDALLRRAGSDNGLPRINVLVDVYNASSILHRVPIGGEDLDRYDGPARLLLASGDEPFHTSSHGEPLIEHPEPGEPIWVDATGITCRRWNWRQTTRTAIGPNTRRVGFIIDSLDAPDHHGARRAAEQLTELLPAAHARVIDAAGGESC
jgi:DNA/RNA-binding domain of Phe-tRNA-synthetase-like protein